MKNVWVLERFISREECQADIDEAYYLLALATTEAEKQACQQAIDALKKRRAEKDGYWLGYIGRTNYKNWCWEAKDFIRRHKGTEFGKAPLRVVKAQIEDDATTWLDYTNAVVNEGVLRYLYATA